MNRIPAILANIAMITLAVVPGVATSHAQQAKDNSRPSAPEAIHPAFEQHLDELTIKLDNMRQQLIESQNEMDELRTELRGLRQQLAERAATENSARDADSLRASVAQIQDEAEVLQAEVKQHDQTKVETVSKYPLRINGTVLFTSILNSGTPDNVNLPLIALPNVPQSASGSLSATVSQTVIGLDASGPHLWGAVSSADLAIDFWGGESSANYSGAGVEPRLRTGHARLEWPNRSLSVALDRPLVSPWQPTSWVSVGEPALAWSGNLWLWSPQLEFKQDRLLGNQHLDVGFGLIDSAAPSSYTATQPGAANASERSRQPGYEARLGSELSLHDRPLQFGASGYYSRQSYSYDQHINAWAGAADWNISISRLINFSGQLYRGQAIGGLGGGTFKDYVNYAPYGEVRALNAAGGWAQAKVTISPSLQLNVSGGMDNSFASDLRNSYQVSGQGYYASLARNQTALANLVYRPKSYLMITTEFRQIDSRSITGQTGQDRIFGLATGYIF